jgi:hypothetical protein
VFHPRNFPHVLDEVVVVVGQDASSSPRDLMLD